MSKIICGQIVWNEKEGYGYINFNREFRSLEPITCLDAISDWVKGCSFEYDDHLKRSQAAFDAQRAKVKRQTKRD